jgi:uncharacterized protein (TIGR02246 family)
MKTINYFRIAAACFVLTIITVGCNTAPEKEKEVAINEEVAVVKPDMDAVKAQIQDLENMWAEVDNARDAEKMSNFYAEDAIVMPADKPMIMGREAIKKDLQETLAKRAEGSTARYEVMDIYGDENLVTEIGKSTRMDASGKVVSTGKYIAIWEKRDGKYVCIREMSNSDMKME